MWLSSNVQSRLCFQLCFARCLYWTRRSLFTTLFECCHGEFNQRHVLIYSLVGLCYTITWLAPGVPYTFTIACLTYRDHNYWSLQEFSNSYQSRSEVAPWHTQCLCFCCQANCIHVSNYIQMVQSKLRGIDMFVIIWSKTWFEDIRYI